MAETPARAVMFLRGVTANPTIHGALARAGYTKEAHDEGIALLAEALRLRGDPPPPADTSHAEANAKLTAFADVGFRRARAALGRLHPDYEAAIFGSLDDAPAPPVAVSVFLDRVDGLARGNATARAALATLESRGITTNVRADLARAVAIFQSLPGIELTPRDEKLDLAALVALRAWYVDWSETARAVVGGKESLVRLGMAKRKRRGVAETSEDGKPPRANVPNQ